MDTSALATCNAKAPHDGPYVSGIMACRKQYGHDGQHIGRDVLNRADATWRTPDQHDAQARYNNFGSGTYTVTCTACGWTSTERYPHEGRDDAEARAARHNAENSK